MGGSQNFFLSSCCKEAGKTFSIFCPRSSVCKEESAGIMFRYAGGGGAMETSVKLAVAQMTRAKKRSVLFLSHDLLLPVKRHLQTVPFIGAVGGCAPAVALM